MQEVLEFLININLHLNALITMLGPWIYVVLFCVIFAETGLVVVPFLPGDSLLFAAGSLASISATHGQFALDPHLLVLVLVIAAILGNYCNYCIGSWLGPKVFHFKKSRWFNPEYLHKAHAFYEKFGGRALILARFIPIVRTFAPFVAGVARMTMWRFQIFNVIGSVAWVAGIIYLGLWIGFSPMVQENFSYIILAMIVLSILPPVIGIMRHKLSSRKENQE
jgi:membrane-associated protein